MSNQALRSDSQTDNIPDLVVLLSALDIDLEVHAFLSELHPVTAGAVLCGLEPQALANVLAMVGAAGCAVLFEALADQPAVLDTLQTMLDTLQAPHVAPDLVADGKLAAVSKSTVEAAKAAAVGRKYEATADLESPDLSAIAESKLDAELSDYGIEQAQKRGAEEPAFQELVSGAAKHGAVCGVSAHKKEAIKFAQNLADQMFLPVAVLLGLDCCCKFGADGEPTNTEYPRCADAPRLLVEYVGLANISIKAAQEAVLAQGKFANAKQRSAVAKSARNTIAMRIKRQLDKYGVSVNIQTGNYCEIELECGPTKSEKAYKAVLGAFEKSTEGALDGLLALDGKAWCEMFAFVQDVQAKRDRVAREAQSASLGAMFLSNAIKVRTQAMLDAANNN
jgi:hypothetical protein